MKVTTNETLYMKNMVLHWSTIYETHYIKNMVLLWSTSVEKEIVTLPLFIFFIFFSFFLFFWAFLFLAFLFFYWDNALLDDDHHTSIYLQLNDYNSILEQGMTLYECLWRCTGICNESSVTCIKIMHGGFATNTMSTTWSCNGNMAKVMYVMMMINGTVESCMAIYLGMAMEMP